MNIEEYKKLSIEKSKQYNDNKYHARTVEIDGIKFKTQKEANYYLDLKLQLRSGYIKKFERQVPFEICKGKKYYLDFMVWNPDGSIRFIDAQEKHTRAAKMQRQVIQDKYGFKIEVV